MVVSGDVLLDIACSPHVRAAVQAVFPRARVRVHDVDAFIASNRAALNQACAVVLGMRNLQGEPSTPIIERLRSIAPHIGVLVVEERSESIDPWLRRLAASGADDAFALDRPGDEKILHEVLANRVALPPPELALRQLSSIWADSAVRVEAMYCVRNGYRSRHHFKPHPWFGLKEVEMRRKFEKVAFPTPLFLTRFGRVLQWKESRTRAESSPSILATLLGFATLEELRKERHRVRVGVARWPNLAALIG